MQAVENDGCTHRSRNKPVDVSDVEDFTGDTGNLGAVSVGNNVNSPIRTSAIGLLQHLQLLYLPSELDIDEQIQQVTLYFYCM
jgi:hypothetical protein